MTESELLTAHLSDKLALCRKNDMLVFSRFLDFTERSEAARFCASRKASSVFYGGYDDAERTLCVFLPDFFSADMFPSYFYENPDDCPVCAVRCECAAGSPPLSHRDYLGSLLALGIKRTSVGDILVSDRSADIFVLPPLVPLILQDYSRAGRVPVKVSQISPRDIVLPEARVEHLRDTVASPRLDAVISAVFSLSRSKAEEAVLGGIVFVNDVRIIKPDLKISDGDKLVLRGSGKVKITSSGELSKKVRTVILFDKYL